MAARELHEVETLAHQLMAQHGLHDWTFAFDRATTRLGCCQHRRKLITVSRYHAEQSPLAQVTDTILHEIAHALAPVTALHGPEWKAIARRIGATPKATSDAVLLDVPPPKSGGRIWRHGAPYVAFCAGCHKLSTRRKRPPSWGNRLMACTACCNAHSGGQFDMRFALTWLHSDDYSVASGFAVPNPITIPDPAVLAAWRGPVVAAALAAEPVTAMPSDIVRSGGIEVAWIDDEDVA